MDKVIKSNYLIDKIQRKRKLNYIKRLEDLYGIWFDVSEETAKTLSIDDILFYEKDSKKKSYIIKKITKMDDIVYRISCDRFKTDMKAKWTPDE